MSHQEELVPVAQYVRMSTEHQQYSILNQVLINQSYATQNGFQVVQTYEDAGRSGLSIQHRPGLRRLLADALSQECPFRVILVYDVSRWGRFQDTDESAHYEFLCRNAGVPIHYCAESFPNTNNSMSSVLKNLKRVMAAEYSRDLSNRVTTAMITLTKLGYRMGSTAPFGFRRMLVSLDGSRNKIMEKGERKYVQTDRILLVPGPVEERNIVKWAFRMAENLPCTTIARRLNSRGVLNVRGAKWTEESVRTMLTNPTYTGRLPWGRTTQKLRSKPRRLEQWLVPWAESPAIKGGQFVDPDTFNRLQPIISARSRRASDAELIERAKRIIAKGDNLSSLALRRNHTSELTIAHHFGSLRKFYEVVGYDLPERIRVSRDHYHDTMELRKHIAIQLTQLWRTTNTSIKQSAAITSVILDGCIVHIQTCRFRVRDRYPRWTFSRIDNGPAELTLLCRLNRDNSAPIDHWVFPPNTRVEYRYSFEETSSCMKRAKRLDYFTQLFQYVLPLTDLSDVQKLEFGRR